MTITSEDEAYKAGAKAYLRGEKAKSPPIGIAMSLCWIQGYKIMEAHKEDKETKGVITAPENKISQFIETVKKEIKEENG